MPLSNTKCFPILGLIACLIGLVPSSQAQLAFWQKYMGGSNFDFGKKVLLQPDGTIVVGAEIRSIDGLGLENHSENQDILLYKMATQEKFFWRITLGGSGEEQLGDLIATRDDGFLLIGTTSSKDGDVSNFHGDTDIWLVKITGEGELEWSRTFGGQGDDRGFCLIQTLDGGYLIGGESGSEDGTFHSPHHGGLDSWVAKLDSKGFVEWEKHFGGLGNEKTIRVHEPFAGQYLIINTSDTKDQDVATNLGRKDVWVFLLNEKAEMIWQKNYGGEGYDEVHDSFMEKDGSIVMVGTTFSTKGDVWIQRGQGDCWLFKINSRGQRLWSQTYGGSKPEGGNALCKTYDGGYLFAGMTKSTNGDIDRNRGYYDGWVVKTDSVGKLIWSRTIGYEAKDEIHDLLELPDGGYLMVGAAQLAAGGTGLPGHHGMGDIWMINMSDPKRAGVRPFITPPILIGKVVDKQTREPLEASITLTDNKSLDSLNQVISSPADGSFIMLLPSYGLVSINVLTKGYLFYGQDLRMDTVSKETTIELLIELEKIQIGSSLILRNIYFDVGKWDLLTPSYAEIERIIAFMELNPRVHILVSGHTDNTGNRNQKMELSRRRAVAVRRYLVNHGINPNRLKEKGYGMLRPIASNATREGRRQNRRVEFQVTLK